MATGASDSGGRPVTGTAAADDLVSGFIAPTPS